jgi:predicted metal-dependent peptidase
MKSNDIQQKIATARTKLILDKPFLGALVLRLPLQEASPEWCKTTGTDARKFYYNPEYIEALRPIEMQFVLAHEALHCALSHFARKEHRVKHRWDLACDYAINPILIADGLTPPPNVMVLKQYTGMSAEEIYPLLSDNDNSESMDQHLYDKQDNPQEGGQEQQENPLDQQTENKPPKKSKSKSNGNKKDPENSDTKGAGEQQFDQHAGGKSAPPPPLEQAEAEELSIQWQQRMAGAAQQAEQAGKLSGVMKRLVEILRQPRLPWRALLARYMTSAARDDYSYMRPSTRRGGPAIFPTLKSDEINVVVGLDVSGSVTDKELNDCLAEINAIKGQMRARVTLIACDSEIVEGFPCLFEPWEEATLPEAIAGGGTTDFRPVFNWTEQQDRQPDIVIYFTDTYGDFPAYAPPYQVVWLVKGKGQVPWGQRIQLN